VRGPAPETIFNVQAEGFPMDMENNDIQLMSQNILLGLLSFFHDEISKHPDY